MQMKFERRLAVARTACHAASRITTTALVMLAMVFLLSGCSGMRLVDSNVSAFASTAALATPATYRFERLPSQQAQAQLNNGIEDLVAAELAKFGLQRDGVMPKYSVQVEMRSYRDPQAPWDDPRYVSGFFRPFPVMTRYGVVMHYPYPALQFEFPYFRREVHLVMRNIADGQVVFESRANHDGRWPDDEAVVPAMLQAALQGFPNPPRGMRQVVVEIPR